MFQHHNNHLKSPSHAAHSLSCVTCSTSAVMLTKQRSRNSHHYSIRKPSIFFNNKFICTLVLLSFSPVVSATWPNLLRQQQQPQQFNPPSLYRLQTQREPVHGQEKFKAMLRQPSREFSQETQQPGDFQSWETPLNFGDAGQWTVRSVRQGNIILADICCTECPTEPVRVIWNGKVYEKSWNMDKVFQNAQEERQACMDRTLLFDDMQEGTEMFHVPPQSTDPHILGRLRGHVKVMKVHQGFRNRIDNWLQPVQQQKINKDPSIKIVSWDTMGRMTNSKGRSMGNIW